MPVLKFRSVEDMDAPDRRPADEPDEHWWQRVARLWERSRRLNPRRFPSGVHRYRSVEEADAARDGWLRDHVRRLRESRD